LAIVGMNGADAPKPLQLEKVFFGNRAQTGVCV